MDSFLGLEPGIAVKSMLHKKQLLGEIFRVINHKKDSPTPSSTAAGQ
jgi:hypothetical protein